MAMKQETKQAMEFEDKTVERAIKAACEYFGCLEEELDIEIITRGSTGLFGIGGKKARIKATPKIEVAQKTQEDIKDNVESAEPEKMIQEKQEIKELELENQSQAQQKDSGYTREELEEYLKKACAFLNELLEKSGLSGNAETIEQTARPFINITGEDLSLIIGKDGQTLDALEYIVNLAMKRIGPEINYRIMLEATGYRDRRKKSLIALAQRQAIKAKRTGKVVSLQPMPARERRIVHLALKDFRGVRTHSAGDGVQRKVIITPIRKRRSNHRRR